MSTIVSSCSPEKEPTIMNESHISFDCTKVSSQYDCLHLDLYPSTYRLITNENAMIVCSIDPGLYEYVAFAIRQKGKELLIDEDGNILYQCNKPVDSLYAYRNSISIDNESNYHEKITHLDKQFMTVTLRFSSLNRTTGVLGCSCGGINIRSYEPIESYYTNEFEIDEDGTAKIRIPRQNNDSSITIRIPSTGDVISLDDILRKNDYDWDSESLMDYELWIKEDDTKIVAIPIDWVSEPEYDLSTEEYNTPDEKPLYN